MCPSCVYDVCEGKELPADAEEEEEECECEWCGKAIDDECIAVTQDGRSYLLCPSCDEEIKEMNKKEEEAKCRWCNSRGCDEKDEEGRWVHIECA